MVFFDLEKKMIHKLTSSQAYKLTSLQADSLFLYLYTNHRGHGVDASWSVEDLANAGHASLFMDYLTVVDGTLDWSY